MYYHRFKLYSRSSLSCKYIHFLYIYKLQHTFIIITIKKQNVYTFHTYILHNEYFLFWFFKCILMPTCESRSCNNVFLFWSISTWPYVEYNIVLLLPWGIIKDQSAMEYDNFDNLTSYTWLTSINYLKRLSYPKHSEELLKIIAT